MSSVSMPARAASPFGSSAATMGSTTSDRPHSATSNPSSSLTNRMPSRWSSDSLKMVICRSALDGAAGAAGAVGGGSFARGDLNSPRGEGAAAGGGARSLSRRKVCCIAGWITSSSGRPESATPSTQTIRSPICSRGASRVSRWRCASAAPPGTMSTTTESSSRTIPSPAAPRCIKTVKRSARAVRLLAGWSGGFLPPAFRLVELAGGGDVARDLPRLSSVRGERRLLCAPGSTHRSKTKVCLGARLITSVSRRSPSTSPSTSKMRSCSCISGCRSHGDPGKMERIWLYALSSRPSRASPQKTSTVIWMHSYVSFLGEPLGVSSLRLSQPRGVAFDSSSLPWSALTDRRSSCMFFGAPSARGVPLGVPLGPRGDSIPRGVFPERAAAACCFFCILSCR
mmetsp:Transcript_17385/g.41652  ORF Transcript_17385/g.41652 Transcript_17385/m.41652 type:complete len:398 (-) Transcript_17385:3081-4274(-)